MTYTDRQSERLVRLPLWVGLNQEQQAQVIDVISRVQA
jgi:dTDP-4-amino-4,6-dideoxygalactose transaminase